MKQNPAEFLCERVPEAIARDYGGYLTEAQMRTPWTYIGSWNGEISGVLIAHDGEHPGYRVMLVDRPGYVPEESPA
jgi:hypothetical protein